MIQDTGARVMRRLDKLRSDRTKHEDIWRDCLNHSFPVRADGFYGEQYDATALQAKRAKLFDSTSTEAGRTLAASILSGVTPSNSRWFGIAVIGGEDNEDEEGWFDENAQTIWENIHASNYDAEAFECCLDLVGAGWFVLYIDADRQVGGYHFEQWPIHSCFLAASRAGGPADTCYRPYTLTVEQCVATFGLDACSPSTQRKFAEGNLSDPVQVVHAIYPRADGVENAARSKNMPFASCHIDVDTKAVLRESGYQECPFVAPRWQVLQTTAYAIGPMFDALPDVKALNRLVMMEDANTDMAVSGMWVAEDDGVLNPRTVKIGPRKIIVANSVDSIKPLQPASNFNISFTKKEQLQGSIRKTLMADQLQPQDGPAMTATEVHVRQALIRQLLGPIYGRMQAEWLQRMIERCFGLAWRAGILTPPPQSLANRSFRVTFTSPMAKAQKLEEVSAVQNTFTAVAQTAAAKQDPSVWDNVNVDEGIRIIAEGNGAPAKIMRTEDQVAATRDQRQKAMQQAAAQQQQQELMQPAAQEVAKNLATA